MFEKNLKLLIRGLRSFYKILFHSVHLIGNTSFSITL
jgi:hypothetical protein